MTAVPLISFGLVLGPVKLLLTPVGCNFLYSYKCLRLVVSMFVGLRRYIYGFCESYDLFWILFLSYCYDDNA